MEGLTLLTETKRPLFWESKAKDQPVPQGSTRARWGCLQKGHSTSAHSPETSHWALPWPQTWGHVALGHQILESLRSWDR